jgi:7-carboxy-7-deazaguanine synthase
VIEIDQLSTAQVRLPMVEIYETLEGEGTRAGYPTVFVRIFGCNLRCSWCDTTYSYAPAQAESVMSIDDIVQTATSFAARYLCLTGGEPLMYGDKSLQLIQELLASKKFDDIHIETNGAIDLQPFIEQVPEARFIMDYKLIDSAEHQAMIPANIGLLRAQDELKFVIASVADFLQAKQVLSQFPTQATVLFSPVWETMTPSELAALILEHKLVDVRMSLQLHKMIWNANQRGV